MRKLVVGLALLCAAVLLPGCLPGGGHIGDNLPDYYVVDVSYNIGSVVISTLLNDPEPHEEIEPITAIISSRAMLSPVDYNLVGDIVASGLTVGIEIVLNETKDMILSLTAVREKTSGVAGEWHRLDHIMAQNIPLVSPETGQSVNMSVYRLTGTASCDAVTFLNYTNVRSPTPAIPQAGPSYIVKNTGSQQCNEFSYLEVVIEFIE